MPRTVKEMAAYVNNAVDHGMAFGVGWCKKMCGTDAYLIPSDGTPDATSAWQHTRHRFTGAWIWGAFAYWTGGSHGHGHVVIMRWRKGHVFSTDYPRAGHWNRTTIAALEAAWPEIKWAGTALDINGVPVRTMPRVIRRWSHG
jgi:hypothetical protein